MARVLTSQVIMILFAASVTAPVADVPLPPTPDVIGANQADSQVLAWALSRFEQIGLQLPALTIRFETDRGACHNWNGFYRSNAQDQARKPLIAICNRPSAIIDPTTDARLTLLHELGHAWTDAALDPDSKQRFARLRGVESWSAPDEAWWQRGIEQAAEILAWGLMADEPFTDVWTRHETCEELETAFTTLTGSSPLHTGLHACNP